ncbi:MAG TPA: hypothetical protein VHD56_15045 [Tepidisphaeraceae bacterium]|nr:hypothetical protein [Tepidisphaeraceae bacterium]
MLNLATVFSLVLLLGGIVFWGLIPYGPRTIGAGRHLYYGFSFQRGGVEFFPYGIRAWVALNTNVPFPPSEQGIWNLCGFWYEVLDPGPGRPMYLFVIPAWFILLCTAALPARWMWLYYGPWRSEQWRKAGCCPNCGYDMRASPERCPECGNRRLT